MGLSAGLCAGVVRPPKCCQATKSDILRSCPDFLSPLVCIEKVGWQQWERVIIWQAGSDTAPRQSDETGVKKQNGRSKRFDSRYLSEACLKRLVKNLSKRLDQQQLLVRSLVTLTVKEWVRSQMYTLFWGFCKINNPFGKSGKNMIIFFFNADVYWSHIATCNAWFTKFAA